MQSPYIIGAIIFFATTIVSRIMKEGAMKHLSPGEKLKLIDAFQNIRKYGSIPLILVVVIFFGTMNSPGKLFWIGFIGGLILFVGYFVVTYILILKGLREMGICEAYQRALARVRNITFLGFALAGACFLFPIFQALWLIWT